jgi:flavodoxin I
MAKIGIIFGTDTGYTRKTAKLMARKLGDGLVDKPVNINRIAADDFLAYRALILGTPTYGNGMLPGVDTGIAAGSWAEFLPQLKGKDLGGKIIALYGFGDQKKYSDRYANAMGVLYQELLGQGATLIGSWPTEGYEFDSSGAVVDGRFVGLALDDKNQGMMTNERVERWLAAIRPQLEAAL